MALRQEVARLCELLDRCNSRVCTDDISDGGQRRLPSVSRSDSNWNVVIGECIMTDDCLFSPNDTEFTDSRRFCAVLIEPRWAGYLARVSFDLTTYQIWHSNLHVDGVVVRTHSELQGTVPHSLIVYSYASGHIS